MLHVPCRSRRLAIKPIHTAERHLPRRMRGAAIAGSATLVEEMLGFANHLGRYAEQTGPDGVALGIFPQALTHLGLDRAAFNLNRTLDGDAT
jgi:GH15 family glucan-1,4-alpha-glucosidase